jgi:hypothetical protein
LNVQVNFIAASCGELDPNKIKKEAGRCLLLSDAPGETADTNYSVLIILSSHLSSIFLTVQSCGHPRKILSCTLSSGPDFICAGLLGGSLSAVAAHPPITRIDLCPPPVWSQWPLIRRCGHQHNIIAQLTAFHAA